MDLLIIFVLTLILSAAITPVVIYLAHKRAWVVAPRKDRWHTTPTAIYGGVAIFASFLTAFLLSQPHLPEHWLLMACGSAMFGLGLWDDIREMRPQIKFVAQLVVCTLAVSQGITLDNEIIPWEFVSTPLTIFWLVGVTNAVNILDNMDGLSSGVVLSAGLVLALGAYINHIPLVGPLAAMLAGAAGGFLIFNFNPAKIFMGDCGSLFLGFALAAATILSANTAAGASSLVLTLMIPLGALVVPLFDTTLVTFQRTSHGRSIARGGRDHTSHRLVFLGLSEKRAVLILLCISLFCGLGGLFLASYATPLIGAILVLLLVVGLVIFGVYLSEVKVYDSGAKPGQRWQSPLLGTRVLHKRQLLQISTDMALLVAAYTAAWLLRFEGSLTPWHQGLLAQSLPWLLAVKMPCLWFFGLYRGKWRYLSVHDLVQIAKASLLGSLIFATLLAAVFNFSLYSRSVLLIDSILTLLFITGARSLIRVFREKLRGNKGIPVLILGAGDGGELLLRELRNNRSLNFMPKGFVDDDPAKQNQIIHGIRVIGTRRDLPRLIGKHMVERVFISIIKDEGQNFADVFQVCQDCGTECSRIKPMVKL